MLCTINQIVYDVLESGEADILNLKQLYSNLETECKSSSTAIPDEISHKMTHVLEEWAIIHNLSLDLKTALNTVPVHSVPVHDGEHIKS